MSDGTKDPVRVTGVPAEPNSNGSLPVRRALEDLKANYPEQWCLYIFGLRYFQQVAESKPLSYYQIAGIHGRPFQKWPDANWNTSERTKENPEGSFGGFCTHTSILFLPWHRPYLALFEQELYKHVQRAGQEFADAQAKPGWKGDRKDWTGAAKNFRMPFWDWADPLKDVIPADTLTEMINIWTPDTYPQKKYVDNPLYAYKFANTSEDGTREGSQYTFRWGVKSTAEARAEILNNKLDTPLRKKQTQFKGTNLTERVCYILQAYERYGPFSHDAFSAGHPETYGSMEDIHNTIHTTTGGGGHMSGIEVSAFDPIFWLHHTNIDRMFAIWQILHGSTSEEPYVVPTSAKKPNWTTGVGEEENEETPLQPFNQTSEKSNFWKASGVKETKTFGYYYPETEQWKFAGKQADFRKAVTDKINVLYPAGSLANTIQAKLKGKTASIKLLRSRAEVVPAAQEVAPAPGEAPRQQQPMKLEERQVEDLAPNNKYLEWITNLKARKHTLGSSFNVHVFLGPITEDNSALWHTVDNHVGAFAVLGQPSDTGCEKCQNDQANELQVTAQIPLTVALVERYLAGQIDGLTPQVVEPYLQENLHWRVTLADGTEVPRGDVEDLIVSIVTNEVTIPENPDALPIYAPLVEIYPSITTRADGMTARGDGTGLTDQAQA